MSWILFFIAMLIAYLFGSLSSAILVCRLSGLPDPRTQGSGNPGATNVMRLGGKKLAALVFVGDFLKGAIPVFLASFILEPVYLGWVGLAAVVGHMFPVFFQFKGGKGVATAAGVLLMLSWKIGLLVMFTWILVVAVFRYSSLGAIIASILAPIYGYWLLGMSGLFPILSMTLLVLWRHRDNIRRLIAGSESKIGRPT